MKNLIHIIFIALLSIASMQVYGNYTLYPADYSWCGVTYPTNYLTRSFSIYESRNNGSTGFGKGQTNATLILNLSPGFEFDVNNSSDTVYANTMVNYEVTVDTFYYVGVSQLFVVISTDVNTNNDKNTIFFENFRIRATSAYTGGMLFRSGGTFIVDQETNLPGSTEPFAYLNAYTPFILSSCTATGYKTSLDSIPQYAINTSGSKYGIIKIKISGVGNCGNSNISGFTFSTNGKNGAGTDSVGNILNAVVFYNNNNDSLPSARLFGYYRPAGYLVNPDTGFTFSDTSFYVGCTAAGGYIPLLNGDNYFWLCYDVAGDAYTSTGKNKLDATLKSFVFNGITNTSIASPSPSGYRVIKPAKFYFSKMSGSWTDDIWALTDNGPLSHVQPNGGGIVVIDTSHQVDLNKTRMVDGLEIRNGGYLYVGGSSIDITTNGFLKTYGTGHFKFMGNYTVRGDLIMTGTGLSEFHKLGLVERDLNIGAGCILLNSSSSTFDFRIGGNLTINGTLENAGGFVLNTIMYGPSATIDGTGFINTELFTVEGGYKQVLPTADLTYYGRFTIQGAGTYVDNYGKMNIHGSMDGDNSISAWINKSNSVLSYGGRYDMFLTRGYLDAREDYNTVIYSRDTNNVNSSVQNIILPKDSIYYHLVLAGIGDKTLSQNIHLHGDFTTNTSFVHNSKTMVVDGVVMQYFKGTTSPTMYNLTMNNSAPIGGLTLQLPVFYAGPGKLTLNYGKIFTTMTNILTANDNTTATSGKVVSFVHGPMKKVGDDAFVFPVGKNNIWARIGMSAPVVGNVTSSFTAEYFDQKYPDSTTLFPVDHISRVEYWNLLRNVGSDNIKVSLYWEDAVRSGIDNYDSLVVAGYVPSVWNNRDKSTVNKNNPGNITSIVVSTFGPFTFGTKGNKNNPLPINLIEFDAKLSGDEVELFWSTQSETNNDYFTIEKSRDAINFEPFVIIDGAGNSNEWLRYSTIDNKPYNGITYYRLKQTDFDGKYSYSDIVDVVYVKASTDDFIVYPNPFISSVNFCFKDITDDNNAQLKIYNLMGVEVINKSISGQFTTIDTYSLPSGTYTYNLTIENKITYTGRLIKQ